MFYGLIKTLKRSYHLNKKSGPRSLLFTVNNKLKVKKKNMFIKQINMFIKQIK